MPDFATLKPVDQQPDFSTLRPVNATVQATSKPVSSTLLTPAIEGIDGLKTLYGGGENGIANKLKNDIQAGSSDIEKGLTQGEDLSPSGVFNVVKGTLKAGLRTAGDVAGAVYAPIGALIATTGIGKVFERAQKDLEEGKGQVGQAIDYVTSFPAVQEFALKHPNASEDFNRVLNLLFASQDQGKIEPKTAVPRTITQIENLPNTIDKNLVQPIRDLRPTAEQINTERQNKLNQGFDEQNTRLKSADKSFNKNTIIRDTGKVDTAGNPVKETITPIDTFAKYKIAPVVEKGSIQMGDYKTGAGELGKIKSNVERIDADIDTKLVNTGQKLDINDLESKAIEKVKSNEEFKRSGTVQTNINKIKTRFEDYRQSYGDQIDIAELNNIRKVANKDYSPDTQDTSLIIGDTAREVVYDAIPDKVIRTLLRQQGELLAAKKYAETINGTKVKGGRLGNYAMRTVGTMIGSTIKKTPLVGSLLGALGGEAAATALQQTQFKSFWTELKSLIASEPKKIEPSSTKKLR